MKAPRKANLKLPELEPEDACRYVRFDLDDENTGAIFWSDEEGFVLKLPDVGDNDLLPIPLYILGLCFMRLKDPDFTQDLIAWAERKPH